MADKNLVLVVGAYDDESAAEADYQSLKDDQAAGQFDIVGAVVMSRDDDGKVEVKEHESGTVGKGAAWGAGAGVVVGLFAPPLLAATAVGAGIGAVIGAFRKRHDEKQIGVDVDEYLPKGSSAVIAVVDDQWADRVENALVKAQKRISKAIDSGDYDELQKAIQKSEEDLDKASS
ncbi:DUF1269 domain-containing protein [Leifsonia sp. NPDC077715]|uniref:DUF1269 domain-containing protein n=1 Tax=Leifsonia sp. NPDC077715 TaxID=3155539 RepID=UPI003444BBDE